MIVSDNGTAFTGNAILRWADQSRVAWHDIAPRNPTSSAPSPAAHPAPKSNADRSSELRIG